MEWKPTLDFRQIVIGKACYGSGERKFYKLQQRYTLEPYYSELVKRLENGAVTSAIDFEKWVDVPVYEEHELMGNK